LRHNGRQRNRDTVGVTQGHTHTQRHTPHTFRDIMGDKGTETLWESMGDKGTETLGEAHRVTHTHRDTHPGRDTHTH